VAQRNRIPVFSGRADKKADIFIRKRIFPIFPDLFAVFAGISDNILRCAPKFMDRQKEMERSLSVYAGMNGIMLK
jgi:hypothetical protein